MPTRTETIRRERTRRINREHRNNYLSAVAIHHARCAHVAADMHELISIVPREQWPIELLEYMASAIEKSHVEAFGVPTSGEDKS